MTDKQDWGLEPWDDNFVLKCKDTKVAKEMEQRWNYCNYILERCGQGAIDPGRVSTCVSACAGIPTEVLERVEQGKSSIIVADEIINGQRQHYQMPESVKEALDDKAATGD